MAPTAERLIPAAHSRNQGLVVLKWQRAAIPRKDVRRREPVQPLLLGQGYLVMYTCLLQAAMANPFWGTQRVERAKLDVGED